MAPHPASAPELVSWLGAVQSQDFSGAKWALARRTGADEAAIDAAFDAGAILRTHILRPTWHFVSPSDIRWMLQVSAPRVHAANAYYYRQSGLDPSTLRRAETVLRRELLHQRFRTRDELAQALTGEGIVAKGLALAYIVMHAELESLICSGPRRGRQFTYALLDERAEAAPAVSMDAALERLTLRYFTSHGPATLRDFSWWSGLSMSQARKGVEMLGDELSQTLADGLRLYGTPDAPLAMAIPQVLLLPNYDEFLIAYKDREVTRRVDAGDVSVTRREAYVHHLLLKGRVAGSWRTVVGRQSVDVEVATDNAPTPPEARAIAEEADRIGRFMNVAARVILSRTPTS